jgi:hypothetical protein
MELHYCPEEITNNYAIILRCLRNYFSRFQHPGVDTLHNIRKGGEEKPDSMDLETLTIADKFNLISIV